jgi:hypothetical protein
MTVACKDDGAYSLDRCINLEVRQKSLGATMPGWKFRSGDVIKPWTWGLALCQVRVETRMDGL